jgi:hypothetical protein
MVEELIIHIGSHKTGSTSFQHTLYRYRDESTAYINLFPKKLTGRLNKVDLSNHFIYSWLFHKKRSKNIDNVIVKDLINPNNKDDVTESSAYKEIFTDREIAVRLQKSMFFSLPVSEVKRTLRRHLISQIHSNKKRLILSAEILCWCSPNYKQNLFNFFKSKGVKNIKVVCVARNPVDLARSAFTHKFLLGLRYDKTWMEKDFLNFYDKNGNYSLRYEPEPAQLNHWKKIVGKENLTVLPYSKDINKKLYDFCNVNPTNVILKNVSKSVNTLRIISYAVKNKLIKRSRFDKFVDCLKNSIECRKYDGKMAIIPVNYFIEYADYNQIEYLKKEYGISFKSYEDYTKEEKAIEYKNANELINDFSKITKEEISFLIKDNNLKSTELNDVLKELIQNLA